MIRIPFLALLLAVASLTAAEKPLNVLLIAVDDLRPDLGCYGETRASSPNIDKLAAGATLFRRHYVQVATCGASRFALLTGRSPETSGVSGGNDCFEKLPRKAAEGARTMPELFRQNGYHTVCIGKISHTADGKSYAYNGKDSGRDELPDAWDELATPYGSWKRGWGIFFAYTNGRHREDGSGFRPLMQFEAEKDEDLPDGMLAATAVAQLQSLAKADKPFFLGVGFIKPHLPWVATRGDWEASADAADAPQVSTKLASRWGKSSGEMFNYASEVRGTRDVPDALTPTYRRAYRACVRYVDRQVGKVLDALEETGLADNTVVVLWGDHGWDIGEQRLWGKHKPLERANRSPLIIRAPGAPAGQVIEAPVETIDVYPTLVDVCGLRKTVTDKPLDGGSLGPVIAGKSESLRDNAISFWGKAVSIRRGSHRLVAVRANNKLQAIELYRISDGGEAGGPNLIQSHPEIASEMLAIAETRLAATRNAGKAERNGD